jgi:hypothetical protein
MRCRFCKLDCRRFIVATGVLHYTGAIPLYNYALTDSAFIVQRTAGSHCFSQMFRWSNQFELYQLHPCINRIWRGGKSALNVLRWRVRIGHFLFSSACFFFFPRSSMLLPVLVRPVRCAAACAASLSNMLASHSPNSRHSFWASFELMNW